MAHQVETMAWTGDVPWHGLGVEVDSNLKPSRNAESGSVRLDS